MHPQNFQAQSTNQPNSAHLPSLLPSQVSGPICFRFYGYRLSENKDSEISQLPEESAVWIS